LAGRQASNKDLTSPFIYILLLLLLFQSQTTPKQRERRKKEEEEEEGRIQGGSPKRSRMISTESPSITEA
jgi:hypothetical protein